jgi:hypothetical protein
MKFDFSIVLNDLDGVPVEDTGKREIDQNTGKMTKRGPTLRLGDVCAASLATAQKAPDGKDLDGEQKLKYYILAAQIRDQLKPDGPQADLTIEQVALLKAIVAQNYVPLISGQCWQIFEKGDSTQ